MLCILSEQTESKLGILTGLPKPPRSNRTQQLIKLLFIAQENPNQKKKVSKEDRLRIQRIIK